MSAEERLRRACPSHFGRVGTAGLCRGHSSADRFIGGTHGRERVLGLLRWWLDDDESLAPDETSDAFVALTLPGMAAVLGVAPERLMATGDIAP